MQVAPVHPDVKRPLWSVIIPTYHCASYLKETLLSVLDQDPGSENMEIIVTDDHSTRDNPEQIVNDYGGGRVLFFRQEKNVGKVRNYEAGIMASKGIFIHQLHGDDKVRYGFYTEMEQIFNDNPMAQAAFCRSLYIDDKSRWIGMTGMVSNEEGIAKDILGELYINQLIQTPSMVVKRRVYEDLGGFDRRLDCFEDWEMWIRIANYYPIAVSDKVLAEYRSHHENATNLTFGNGTALKTFPLLSRIVDGYVDPEIKIKMRMKKRKASASFLLLSVKERKKSMRWDIKFGMGLKAMVLYPSLRNFYIFLQCL